MALSTKNSERVIRDVHDELNSALRVVATVLGVDVNVTAITDSIKIGDGLGNYATISTVGATQALDVAVQDITIDHANDSIRIGDGSSLVTTTTDGSDVGLDVNLVGSALTELQNLNTNISNLTLDESTDSITARTVNKSEITTGSGSSNGAILWSGDTSDYSSLGIQLTGTFTATVSVYASNDNSNWVLTNVQTNTLGTATITQTINTANQLYFTGVNYKYYKFQITSYTSGTVSLLLFLSTSEVDLPGAQVVGVSGAVQTTGYATSWGVYSSAAADGVVTPAVSFQNYSQISMQIYGGFTATVIFEASENNSIWQQVNVIDAETNERVWDCNYNGLFIYTGELTYFRARISEYTSGTVYCRTLTNQNNYSRTIVSSAEKALFNLKTLEVTGVSLDDYLTTDDGELLYMQNGSLLKLE